ncbi:MAG: RidA family protein [Pseudomonadales bacterium]|nr:RidA family protein [Pseudomonadales bacterium]
MSKEKNRSVSPVDMMQPVGAYSQAVWEPAGRTLHIAGQTGVTKDKRLPGDGGIEAQTQQLFENLKLILEAAGGDLSSIVSTTVYLTDIKDNEAFNTVRAKYFENMLPPTSTLLVVSQLFTKALLVEITAVAVVPQ